MKPTPMYGVYDAGMDGRGIPVLKGVYRLQHEATTRAGVYRHVAPAWVIGPTGDGQFYLLAGPAPIPIGRDLDEAAREARQAALAKLNAADRAALGIADL